MLSEPVISIAKIIVSSKTAEPANSIHQPQARGKIIQGMELQSNNLTLIRVGGTPRAPPGR